MEHQRPGGLTKNIKLTQCKSEMINTDFITGLPRYHKQHDSILVIIDRITKLAYFLPVKTSHLARDYAKLYIKEVFRLHRVLLSINFETGAQFGT